MKDSFWSNTYYDRKVTYLVRFCQTPNIYIYIYIYIYISNLCVSSSVTRTFYVKFQIFMIYHIISRRHLSCPKRHSFSWSSSCHHIHYVSNDQYLILMNYSLSCLSLIFDKDITSSCKSIHFWYTDDYKAPHYHYVIYLDHFSFPYY